MSPLLFHKLMKVSLSATFKPRPWQMNACVTWTAWRWRIWQSRSKLPAGRCLCVSWVAACCAHRMAAVHIKRAMTKGQGTFWLVGWHHPWFCGTYPVPLLHDSIVSCFELLGRLPFHRMRIRTVCPSPNSCYKCDLSGTREFLFPKSNAPRS